MQITPDELDAIRKKAVESVGMATVPGVSVNGRIAMWADPIKNTAFLSLVVVLNGKEHTRTREFLDTQLFRMTRPEGANFVAKELQSFIDYLIETELFKGIFESANALTAKFWR